MAGAWRLVERVPPIKVAGPFAQIGTYNTTTGVFTPTEATMAPRAATDDQPPVLAQARDLADAQIREARRPLPSRDGVNFLGSPERFTAQLDAVDMARAETGKDGGITVSSGAHFQNTRKFPDLEAAVAWIVRNRAALKRAREA
jgi:hypothetical protein